MTLPVVTLYPTGTVTNAPFCSGYAFVKGAVPSGSQVVAPFSDFQCVTKNRWPDGSLKFAVLSGRVSVTANTPLPIPLSIGTPVAGTDIDASSITSVATVDCGTFGSVTWSGNDWASPFTTWVSGPKMSSFIYRKAVGSDDHLVAWLEVRVWSGGEVDILPWIENGYFFKAAPTNKSATYTFTLNGAQQFSAAINLKHHQRTPLISGSMLSYGAGGIVSLPDSDYLQQTNLVPTYSAVTSTANLSALLPTTFTPLQQGGFDYPSDVMSGTGYSSAIGLIPTHDVAALVCTDNPVLRYSSVVRNGYSAGRYGIHFRDETTNYPPKFSTYPTAGLWDSGSIKNAGAVNGASTPAATGGSSPQWDMAHCPAIGYMAYLLTGRFYFMEEVQFAAITNHFSYTDWVRAGGTDTNGYHYTGSNGASGIYVGYPETRTAAWGVRSLFLAASVTPDGHSLQNEFVHSVEENARYFKEVYSGQTANIFGNIAGGEGSYPDWPGIYAVPMFQQNFVTAAWGMGLAMDLPISTTAKDNMATFFAWKAKGVVGCLGSSTGFWYINGAQFIMPASPTRAVDIVGGTGPWYSSFKQAYDALVANFVPSYGFPLSTTEGQLYYEDTALRVRGMWGVTMPAIAYAVQHNVPGAAAAYNRVINASNYNLFTNDLAGAPVWGVAPSNVTQGEIMANPGPHGVMDTVCLLGSGYGLMDVHRGYGVPLSAVEGVAGDETTPWFDAIENTDDVASELRVVATDVPTQGVLDVDSNAGVIYTGAADTATFDVFIDNVLYGSTTITFEGVGEVPVSTVSAVVISPSTISSNGSTVRTLSATVNGTNNPSQAVTWTKTSGGGTLTGASFTEPVQTTSQQVIVLRATSVQDTSKFATLTITIAASSAPPTGGGSSYKVVALVNGRLKLVTLN